MMRETSSIRDFLQETVWSFSSVMSPVDQGGSGTGMAGEGFSCDLWVDPPGQVWEDYRHATDELWSC